MSKERIIRTTHDLDSIKRVIQGEGMNSKNYPLLQRPSLRAALDWDYPATGSSAHGSFSGLDEPDWGTALEWAAPAAPRVAWRIDFYANVASNTWSINCVISTSSTTAAVPNRVLDAIEKQLS